jgi:hypothetical protein
MVWGENWGIHGDTDGYSILGAWDHFVKVTKTDLHTCNQYIYINIYIYIDIYIYILGVERTHVGPSGCFLPNGVIYSNLLMLLIKLKIQKLSCPLLLRSWRVLLAAGTQKTGWSQLWNDE